MTEDVRDSEAWVIRQAERLSVLMKAQPDDMPPYVKSVGALAVVMAGAFNLPCYRMLAERVQCEHRAQHHAGASSQECEACGWYDGAVYKATTGRQYTEDFPELFQKRSVE